MDAVPIKIDTLGRFELIIVLEVEPKCDLKAIKVQILSKDCHPNTVLDASWGAKPLTLSLAWLLRVTYASALRFNRYWP